MSTSSLLSDTFSLFLKHFMVFITLGLAAGVPLTAARLVAGGDPTGLSALVQLIVLPIPAIASAMIHQAAWDLLTGAKPDMERWFSRGVRVFVPLILLSIVILLLVVLGLVLLIVPGLYLFAAFFLTIPALVVGDKGWGSLAHSWQMTEGHRWTILAAGLGWTVISLLAALLFSPLAAVIGLGIAFEAFANAVGLAVAGILATVVYARIETGRA